MQSRRLFHYRALAMVMAVAIIRGDLRVASGRTHRAFGSILPQGHTMRLRHAKAEQVARQMSEDLPAGAELTFDVVDNSITLLGPSSAVVSLRRRAESLDEMSKPSSEPLVARMALLGPETQRALNRALRAARDANRRDNARPK